MTWLRVSACFLAVSALVAPSLASVCPNSCVCTTTRDGLHRATCSNLAELYKFTLRQKHHNINILDLSHNNVTKLSHELDRLTEIVTLDLSTNGITELNKFLHNAKKLVHLNLAHNRIQKLSLLHMPTSISSLDLTNNLLENVPSDLEHLVSLEHLELEGNPLDCSCDNIRARDRLLIANVFIDKVKCASPIKLNGRSWLELKTKDICKIHRAEPNYIDMMMGDQPIDAERIGEETTALKSMPIMANSVLEEGNVIQGGIPSEDDDSQQFLKVARSTSPSPLNEIEGSGETESTTIYDFIEVKQENKLLASDEILPIENIHTTDDPLEGSGEGSGFGVLKSAFDYDDHMIDTTTTPIIEDLTPGPVHRAFTDDDDGESNTSTEYPIPKVPSIFEGGPNWHIQHTEPPIVTVKPATLQITPDTTISQKVINDLASKAADLDSDKQQPHKTGTYICIAIIVVLLVGLIGFAIIKGQMRKNRDRRLLRQQKSDVEKASKEMVDMNKSLLGKAAVAENPMDRKVNGKYELVPTHESLQKKSENRDIGNGFTHTETNGTNGLRTDSPRDTNQNKNSSKDNNLLEEKPDPVQDTSFDSGPEYPHSRKDSHSLSSEDIMFDPLKDFDTPRLNGNADSDISHLINGDHNTVSDLLSPSREYVPVYSPDMGRVRIKLAETPKPKTPVLVTRSRSNAGDIIITPSLSGNVRKSTT